MERKEVNIVQGVILRNNLHCYVSPLILIYSIEFKEKIKGSKSSNA